jgi:membrane protein
MAPRPAIFIDYMLSKTVHSISRSTTDMINVSVDMVRGLTWSEVRDLVKFARRRVSKERLPQVAGSLTYTTTLALVPLLTIILAIFTTFPIFSNFRSALDAYFLQNLMPKGIVNTIVSNLTMFASKATRLSAVGAVALLFTSATMMGIIERAFNQIWRVKQARPWAQRVLVYWALVTLGPLMVGLSLTITSQLFMVTSGVADTLPMFSAIIYTLFSVGLTTAGYTLLYMTVPNRFVDWRDAVWGGLVAAVAFEVAKRLFGIFIRQFPTYTLIYGALAALPVFLVWVYLSWMITLVGALLTAALPVVKYERWWHEPVPGSAFVDAMAVLKVLYEGAHLSESALVSSASIRHHTRIGYDEMTTLLEQMLAAGWVGRVQTGETTRAKWGKGVRETADNWVLLINVNTLKLADVYRMFVFGALSVSAVEATTATELDTAALARQVECAVEKGLDQTLAEHFGASDAEADPAANDEPRRAAN